MDIYETISKNLDKDVEDLEQLRATPLISDCNIWDQEIHLLKDKRDVMNSVKNILHEVEQLDEAMRGHINEIRQFHVENQVRLIKTIGEVEKQLKAFDPNDEFNILQSDSARQQLGYTRQKAIRKMSEVMRELGFWGKATAWCLCTFS
ncbi:hypothetical protein ACLB2K_001511 [Fragaria x ananassa]